MPEDHDEAPAPPPSPEPVIDDADVFLDDEDQVEQERSIGARIFEVSLESLAEQERAVRNMRDRAAPLLAGGLVGAGLLARPAFERGHPDVLAEWVAIGLAGVGGLVLLMAVVALSWPNDLAFSLRANEAYEALYRAGVTAQPHADLTLAQAIDERRDRNEPAVRWLTRCLLVAGVALVVEIGGFAVAAALASG